MLSSLDPRLVEAIGYLAAALTTISFVPQVLKTWRSKSVGDLSTVMLAMFTLGVFLWLLYGVAHRSLPITLANAVTFVQALVLVGLSIRHK